MATMPVVVGVDGSRESLRAAEWAAREAERHGAPLRIVSAPAMPPRMRAGDTVPRTVADELRGVSLRALEEAFTHAQEIAPHLFIDVDPLTGPPAVAVTDSGSGALMLVVGARGAGGFAAVVLGSLSRYAAMHASCPVVVVREETSAVHHEVVVGVRDPRDATGTMSFAFEEAALRGATLVAVHAWYWFPSALSVRGGAGEGRGQAADAGRISAEAERNLAGALGSWHDKYPDVPVRHDVVHGHPARVLAGCSARADLVVIGRDGGAGAGPVTGAVQHAVLNHARGPVAVVPAGS